MILNIKGLSFKRKKSGFPVTDKTGFSLILFSTDRMTEK